MATRHILYWFDVEDCTVTQSDDAAKRLCEILLSHGVRGTMKLVGQKARLLRERVRYDVIDALAKHAIGYHTDWHGLRPQPAEYLGPLDWLQAGEEFERRERRGVDEILALWGRRPVCYGQPGSNWSAAVFPILRKWRIPTYVSAFGIIGLYAKPFYLGGIINTSHMYGKDRRGREVCHAFGLNFELGEPGELDRHKAQLAASFNALEDGGLISIMNHPCTLVLERWFSTDMKTREQTLAGYAHFEAFVRHVAEHEDCRAVTAEDLPSLYPDPAREHAFTCDELLSLARGVEGAYFTETDGLCLSAAELFGLLCNMVHTRVVTGELPSALPWRYLDGPALPAGETTFGFAVDGDAFAASVETVWRFLVQSGRLPDVVELDGGRVAPGDYYAALAQVAAGLVADGRLPAEVQIRPTECLFERHVDREAAASALRGSMMPPGFEAPKLLEQALLQAWTLKPAVLTVRAGR